MTKPSKLREILNRLATDAGRWVLYEQDGQVAKGAGISLPVFDSSDAEAAIKTLMLEMVGPDEPTYTHTSDHEDVTDHEAVGRNQLRAKLRAKIEEA